MALQSARVLRALLPRLAMAARARAPQVQHVGARRLLSHDAHESDGPLDAIEKGRHFQSQVWKRPGETREARLRRLKYQVEHRGVVEAEILLTTFFRTHVDRLSDADLDVFEDVLTEHDPDLVSWVTRKTDAPERFPPSLVEAMREHAESDPLRRKRANPEVYIG